MEVWWAQSDEAVMPTERTRVPSDPHEAPFYFTYTFDIPYKDLNCLYVQKVPWSNADVFQFMLPNKLDGFCTIDDYFC